MLKSKIYKMSLKPKEKKPEILENSNSITFAINTELKNEFLQMCKILDTDSSKTLRRYIRIFVIENRGQNLTQTKK